MNFHNYTVLNNKVYVCMLVFYFSISILDYIDTILSWWLFIVGHDQLFLFLFFSIF